MSDRQCQVYICWSNVAYWKVTEKNPSACPSAVWVEFSLQPLTVFSFVEKKKEIVGQLDQHGKILSSFDNRSCDSVEHFYQTYQSRRKQDDSLAHIYQCVRWYDQTFHSILLEYAETMYEQRSVLPRYLKWKLVFATSVKVSGMQTRLIDDDELLVHDGSMDGLPKEILCQINCWNDGRNEIDLWSVLTCVSFLKLLTRTRKCTIEKSCLRFWPWVAIILQRNNNQSHLLAVALVVVIQVNIGTYWITDFSFDLTLSIGFKYWRTERRFRFYWISRIRLLTWFQSIPRERDDLSHSPRVVL